MEAGAASPEINRFWCVLRARGPFTGYLIQHQNDLILLLTGFSVKLHTMFQNTEIYQNQAECCVLRERQPWRSFCSSVQITDRAELTQLCRCYSPHQGVKDLTPEIQGTLKDPCQNSRDCGGLSCFIPKSLCLHKRYLSLGFLFWS